MLWGCSGAEAPPDAATHDPGLLGARADFRLHCSACHGRSGAGATNLYPPLSGASWVNNDPEIPIRVVLHGLGGELEVGGERFMNVMPPLGHRLSDVQIAGILTYVRGSWGNTGGPVSPETVREVREKTQDRQKPWTAAELEPLLGGISP